MTIAGRGVKDDVAPGQPDSGYCGFDRARAGVDAGATWEGLMGMYWFAVASFGLVALLVASCLSGGVWPGLALIYVTGFVAAMDRLGGGQLGVRDGRRDEIFARVLMVILALAHFGVLVLGIWAIARAPWLGGWQALFLGVALSQFMGQVSHPNAHELIHAPARVLRVLGVAIYVSLLFGHHASAHRRVHHVHAATLRDPNSARLGEGFYRFWPRAWWGSFRAGFQADTAARSRASRSAISHPYVIYCGGAILALGLAGVLAGWRGVLIYLLVAGYAQMQILLADYVQHYGLYRRIGGNGKPEPMGPQHSWNTSHWYSSALMLNAPRHSDHHLHPMRVFPALRLDPACMPVLPYSLPVMAVIALVPTVWRKMMDPRAARWMQDSGGENMPG